VLPSLTAWPHAAPSRTGNNSSREARGPVVGSRDEPVDEALAAAPGGLAAVELVVDLDECRLGHSLRQGPALGRGKGGAGVRPSRGELEAKSKRHLAVRDGHDQGQAQHGTGHDEPRALWTEADQRREGQAGPDVDHRSHGGPSAIAAFQNLDTHDELFHQTSGMTRSLDPMNESGVVCAFRVLFVRVEWLCLDFLESRVPSRLLVAGRSPSWYQRDFAFSLLPPGWGHKVLFNPLHDSEDRFVLDLLLPSLLSHLSTRRPRDMGHRKTSAACASRYSYSGSGRCSRARAGGAIAAARSTSLLLSSFSAGEGEGGGG
jgi:hypothetical protein